MKKFIPLIFLLATTQCLLAQRHFLVEQHFSAESGLLPGQLVVGNTTYNDLSSALMMAKYKNKSGQTVREEGFYMAAGLFIEIPVTSKLSIRTGGLYMARKFRGFPEGQCETCEGSKAIYFRQRYVDIPLSARYYIIDKRLFLFADAGLTGSILHHTEAYYDDSYMGKPYGHNVDPAPAKKFMLLGTVGFGGGIKMTEVLRLNIAAVYRQGFTPFLDADSYKMKSVGITAGLAFRITYYSINDF
jgi:hypothetical protein